MKSNMIIILSKLLIIAILTIKFMGGAHPNKYFLTDSLFGLFVDFLNLDLVVRVDWHVFIPHLFNCPVLTADYLLVRRVPDAVRPARVVGIEGASRF